MTIPSHARGLLLLAAAMLVMGAAAKRKPQPPSSEPAAAETIAKAPETAPGPGFDTSDPANLSEMLSGAGADVRLDRSEPEAVLLIVTSRVANFSVQYVACDSQGHACKAALFDSRASGAPSLAQLNAFNQSSALCRSYQDATGKPHVTISMLLFPDDTRAHADAALGAWQGCLGDFTAFAKDPVSYLAAAP